MTWTDFNEYNSDVQFQIGQRIQKLRIDKKIAAVDLAAVLDILHTSSSYPPMSFAISLNISTAASSVS